MTGNHRYITIQQTITFAGVAHEQLYDAYLDPDRHAALLGGAPVSITDESGAPFWVFAPDAVRGRILFTHRYALIAQSWRGKVWAESDPDSILTLTFDTDGSMGARVQLTQAGVPGHAYDIIAGGWHEMYWQPWQTNLSRLV